MNRQARRRTSRTPAQATEAGAGVTPETTGVIRFADDTAYAGVWARVDLEVSLNEYFEYRRKRFFSGGDPELVIEAFTWWGDRVLKDWNVNSPQGKKLPATGAGVKDCSPRLVNALIDKWQLALTDVDAPLG